MNTKPILVHVHIFYPELWPELKQHIQNIPPHPFKLFVTLSQQHPTLIQDIKASFPDSQIEIVPNRGFDVGPFMHILNQINLDDYSYIIKLHTKRNCYINTPIFRNMIGNIWRKNLLQFIKDQPSFKQSLDFLATHPKVGMLSSYKSIVKDDHYDAIAAKELKKFLKQHHWPKIKFAFVAGTMFIARANLFKPLQQLHISINDFAEVKGSGTITLPICKEALTMLEVDDLGLDYNDKKILNTIIDKFHGGPVGLDTLAAATGEDSNTIEDVYEPYLLQLGFIARTPRGRVCLPNAYKHLGKTISKERQNYLNMFIEGTEDGRNGQTEN